jgi:hypothetical protein
LRPVPLISCASVISAAFPSFLPFSSPLSQHPTALAPLAAAAPPPPPALRLTKEEARKIRRRRKLEKQQEITDKIRLGLMPVRFQCILFCVSEFAFVSFFFRTLVLSVLCVLSHPEFAFFPLTLSFLSVLFFICVGILPMR